MLENKTNEDNIMNKEIENLRKIQRQIECWTTIDFRIPRFKECSKYYKRYKHSKKSIRVNLFEQVDENGNDFCALVSKSDYVQKGRFEITSIQAESLFNDLGLKRYSINAIEINLDDCKSLISGLIEKSMSKNSVYVKKVSII